MNKKIKEAFPFFKNNEGVTFLDTGATALKLGSVIDSLYNFYTTNGTNINRGAYKYSYNATVLFEETRTLVAKFISANPKEIIFTKGTTDSLNSLAISLSTLIKSGDSIITSELEHHSSFLPWLKVSKEKDANLKFINLNEEGRITLDKFKEVMDESVKVIALTHASNVLGYETPIKDIVKYARTINEDIIIILDAAQSISHKQIDVKDLDVDFLAFSSHKMYGPNGVGVLYGKEDLLNKIPPFAYGGEMADLVYKDSVTYKELPTKFEAGTPVVGEVIAFSEAIKFLNEIGMDNIHKYEMELRNYLEEELSKIDGLVIYNKNSESPLVTFNVVGIHPHDLVSVFGEHDVCVRAGHHCAQLVSSYLGVIATVRASIGIYNNKNDVDKLVIAIKEAISFFGSFGE